MEGGLEPRAGTQRACQIEQVGRARNGQPRWWCKLHGGDAGGRYGTRLVACEAVGADAELVGCLDLDAREYLGGVGVWAALEPVFNTTGQPIEAGIHIHARQKPGSVEKEIDDTFAAVRITCRPDLFGERPILIRRDAAINYYFSRFLDRRVKHLSCTHCGEIHLDAGEFALRPHRQHLCHACGRHFRDNEEAVSNPLALVREALGDTDFNRLPVRARETLDVSLADFPGGVQIWASNPAILWTAPKAEEEGIHVHLFRSPHGAPEPDETYNEVRLNGELLDEAMVRHLMAQKAFPKLAGKVEAFSCPKCREPHFDQGEKGFVAHSEHECEHCGHVFRPSGRHRLSVSNPLVSVFERLSRGRAA